MMQHRRLAKAALLRYGVRSKRLKLLQADRQIVYEIHADNGRHFALRMYPPSTCDSKSLFSQMQWLQALARDTKLHIPIPVANIDGDDVTPIRFGNPSGIWLCTLTQWVAGRRIFRRNGPGSDVLRKVGRLMAGLHEHGRHFKPPADFRCMRWDWEGLFGDSSPWRPVRAMRTDPVTRRLFREVMQKTRATMNALGKGSDVFGLIHGDLIQANYVVHRNQVGAIDFADFGRGYFLYDMAVTLLMLKPFDPHGLQREAFIQGYRDVRPFPVEHEVMLETYIAARAVALCRWISGAVTPGQAELRWMKATIGWLRSRG